MTDQDLTSLVIDALGKRMTDPAATRLAAAAGKKRFRSATPNKSYWIGDRKLGLEVGTSMEIANRAYWPPRKEGRVWVTWVSHAFFYPNYRGSLPADFEFRMGDAALSALFPRRVEGAILAVRFHLPSPAEGLTATAELGENRQPSKLYYSVAKERDYASIYPDSNLEHSVENGFFAAWSALNGVLREGRVATAALETLRARRVTPLSFFRVALAGLFWQNDVKPEFDEFCNAYMKRLMQPDEACHLFDVKRIFGETNYWRQRQEPRQPANEDNWANYDRIALVYAERLEQWRRGEIRSTVCHPP
jgi:hypothetical protein